jgi:hypothetical protein
LGTNVAGARVGALWAYARGGEEQMGLRG